MGFGLVFGCGGDPTEGTDTAEVTGAPAPGGLYEACRRLPGRRCHDRFVGVYYANRHLGGDPAMARTDRVIDFSWGSSGPYMAGARRTDNFSVRWTQQNMLPGGVYTFQITADDGVRLRIDGELVLDAWVEQAPTTYRVTRRLAYGRHKVELEYFEHLGGATVTMAVGYVPDGRDNWYAEFFAGTALKGPPLLATNFHAIDFEWGEGAPAPGLPKDQFSARFIRVLDLEEGLYRMQTVSDDGIVVRLDNDPEPVLSYWNETPPRAMEALVHIPAGEHQITVEYFEAFGGATLSFDLELVGCGDDTWEAQYVSHDLSRPVRATQCEPMTADGIRFDWGQGAPAVAGLGADHFTAIWKGRRHFDAGDYRFWAAADDMVRVTIDGARVFDLREIDGGRRAEAVRYLEGGEHELLIEYTERTDRAFVDVGWRRQCGSRATVVACTAPPNTNPFRGSWVDVVDPATQAVLATGGGDLAGTVVLTVPVDACRAPQGRLVHLRKYEYGEYAGFSEAQLVPGETYHVGDQAFADRPGGWDCQ